MLKIHVDVHRDNDWAIARGFAHENASSAETNPSLSLSAICFLNPWANALVSGKPEMKDAFPK